MLTQLSNFPSGFPEVEPPVREVVDFDHTFKIKECEPFYPPENLLRFTLAGVSHTAECKPHFRFSPFEDGFTVWSNVSWFTLTFAVAILSIDRISLEKLGSAMLVVRELRTHSLAANGPQH